MNRFYDPDSGSIIYGENDVKKLGLKELRDKIGYVGQEPVLIIGTIEENLRYGKQDATDAEMREALESANALFVYDLVDGLKTYVGSSTVQSLSGG